MDSLTYLSTQMKMAKKLKKRKKRYASVVFLVNDDGLICSVSRGRNVDDWNLPGGKGEKGETPEETAIRETREETGLEINNLMHVMTRPRNNKTVHVFMADWKGKIRSSKEGDVRWVTWDTILDSKNTFAKFNRQLFENLNALNE